jgi:predicted DNA-binding transcriptional regulator AlpA
MTFHSNNCVEDLRDSAKVLSFRSWCEIVGISESTGRRLIAAGDGPEIVKLSQRRIGVRLSDHVRWLDSRARPGG